MSVIECPVCGTRINAATARCPDCGADRSRWRRGLHERSQAAAATSPPVPIAPAMTAAVIGAMLATLLLLLAALFGLWWGAGEVAMIAGWAAGVALAVAGISLLAGRRRLSLSGVCFIASAPLVAVASVLLFTSAGGISAAVYFGTPVIVAALLLVLAGVLAFRSASRVALPADQREVLDNRPGPPPVAADPEVLDARPGSPGTPDPVSLPAEGRPRSALVFPLIALAFDAMLLAVLWWWTSVNTEHFGIDTEVQLAFLAWLLGVAVAGVGVILLADAQRRRYAALCPARGRPPRLRCRGRLRGRPFGLRAFGHRGVRGAGPAHSLGVRLIAVPLQWLQGLEA